MKLLSNGQGGVHTWSIYRALRCPGLQGLGVVCGGDAAGAAAALATAREVDPPSRGVALTQASGCCATKYDAAGCIGHDGLCMTPHVLYSKGV